MATGDWVTGSYIKFDVGSSLEMNPDGTVTVGIRYWIVVPSGGQVWPPNGNMFTAASLAPSGTLTTIIGTIAQGLANQEGISVHLADGTVVAPA